MSAGVLLMQPKDAQASSPAETQPTHAPAPINQPSPDIDPVWTYQGYKLDHGDFTAAMVHLYRAEVTRANVWRGRLDVTTNWSLIATSAAFTFAFTSAEAHHSVILLTMLLVTVLLFIEARRYRYYELWSYRVRLMETNFFAPLLVAPFRPGQDWGKNLSQSLQDPEFSISIWEALGRRLRRNYIWIYMVLEISWIAKLLLYPQSITAVPDLVGRSHLGFVRGEFVMGGVLLFDLVLLTTAFLTLRLRKAVGEISE
jgi:uncharacterized membrane protein